jgi:hypothetical protein
MECNLTFTESEFYHAIVYLTFEKVTFGFGVDQWILSRFGTQLALKKM